MHDICIEIFDHTIFTKRFKMNISTSTDTTILHNIDVRCLEELENSSSEINARYAFIINHWVCDPVQQSSLKPTHPFILSTIGGNLDSMKEEQGSLRSDVY